MGEQTQKRSSANRRLRPAGTDKSKLLSANIWITDMAKFAEMNAGSGASGCRPATRRRAPPSRPSSPRPTTWSRSWWSPRNERARNPRHLRRSPPPGREAEFELSFQGERLIERLAVPGFLFGRRHKAVSGAPGYFNFYMVETPEVLSVKTLSQRLDHPTPMTHTIMSESLVRHEPHGVPAHEPARPVSRRLRRHSAAVQPGARRDGVRRRAGQNHCRHGGRRRRR